ncbi:MAG: metal ABC transporter ATP-binding protein [Oscillospiraceae bacterium]|nr:metal ABC transporter ATP-binding protein [Oscillospiraceae bacterium]
MNMGLHGGSCGHACCLRIQDLSVKIGNDTILQDINLHIHCGEMVALIGPNGAGKSTLIKTILGQQPYEGIVTFSVPGQRSRKAKIGYVPQSPTFDIGDSVSVADLFACCMSRRPAFLGQSAAMREKIMECLERVRSENLIDKRIGALSGGELQRVLLALALEPLPNILILDEPLSGVDVEGMETLMDMLDEIRKTYDLSILMITHDFSMLARYADQVVLMDRQIVRQGSAADVLESEEFRQVFHRKGGTQ